VIDSLRHVQVVGALARLAGNGGWGSILAGTPLDDGADLADVDLLVAADVLRRRDDGGIEPSDLHPWYDDPEVLASGLVAQMRRALQHGEGLPLDAVDPDEIAAMGAASESVARILADAILPMLPVTRDRLAAGSARFLDVGVGTGAIAETLCTEFPGTSAVGLDVSPEALSMAEERLGTSSVGDRIELRHQSVVDLSERDAFDLAWLPQIFLTPEDLQLGLARVNRALRPGCWLVMPVAACLPDCSDLERAALEHDAVIRGGGPMSVETATELLAAAGFVEIRDMVGVQQSLLMARRAAAA
jgi:SAM-dependent methyltransferase